MTQRPLYSLRIRLLLLALITLAPAIGLMLYTYALDRQRETVEVQASLVRLARLTAAEHERLIKSTRQVLVLMSRLPEVQEPNVPVCNELLADLLKQYPYYANLGATDPAGNVFCSALPFSAPLNLADRDYLQNALRTRGFAAGSYQIGRITRKPSLNFGYPVLNESGQAQAIVFAALDLNWLSQWATQAELPSDATLTVFDLNSKILLRYPDPQLQWVGQSMPESLIVQAAQNKDEGNLTTLGTDGVPHLYVFTRLPGDSESATFISIGLPVQAAFAEIDNLFTRTLAGLLGIGLLALAAAWLGGNVFIRRPIRAILAASRRLAAGDLTARTGASFDPSELGELAHAVDQMAQALEQREAQRQHIEATLRESEQHLETIYREIPTVIVISSLEDGRYLDVNAAFEQITGYQREEAIGHTATELHLYENPADRARLVGPVQEQGEARNIEIAFRGKQGQRIVGLVSGTRIAVQGRPCLLAVVNDITERKRAEEELAQQRAFSETLREAGAVLASTLDVKVVLERLLEQLSRVVPHDVSNIMLAEGDATRIVQSRGYEQFGITLSETAYPLADSPNLAQIAASSEPLVISDTLTDPRWVRRHERDWRSYVGVPIRARGQLIGILNVNSLTPGLYDDLHAERLRAFADQAAIALQNAQLYEAEREQFHRLQASQEQIVQVEKMAALGRLVATLAHEINNPLQAVMGAIELLYEEMGSQKRPEKLEYYLGMVHRETQRIAAIVRRIRDFYRPAQEEFQPTDIQAVLENVLGLTNSQLQQHRIAVECEWATGLPLVPANPDRLKQVFMNLILNSMDAMIAPGSVLQIRTARDHMTTRDGHNVPAVRIEIADNGVGIPPDVLPHLFEPFFATHANGTGLGLSISYEIIQSHGGQIRAESQVGVGTTFTILLPLRDQSNHRAEQASN